MSLEGKFVWLERKPPINKDRSSYYDGEYIVLKETPHSLHCVKPAAGYDGARPHSFGKHEYNVHEPYVDRQALREFRDDLDHFARAGERGEKLRWVEGVYSDAKNTVRLVRRALQQLSCADECCGQDCDSAEAEREVIVRIVVEQS